VIIGDPSPESQERDLKFCWQIYCFIVGEKLIVACVSGSSSVSYVFGEHDPIIIFDKACNLKFSFCYYFITILGRMSHIFLEFMNNACGTYVST